MNSELEYRNRIRHEYPIGSVVMATIYKLRHKDVYEPQQAIIVGHTSEENVKLGYRFGIIVEFEGREYWVLPNDVTLIKEE